MLRTIVVGGLLLAAVATISLGPEFLHEAGKKESKPDCDLLRGPCQWQTERGDWKVSLAVGEETTQGVEYSLSVSAPRAPDRFLAVLRGENMYMGEYPVPLERVDTLKYQARFTAPFCTTGAEMVWRIDLQDGQNLIENVPSTLVFQAEK